MLSLLLTSCQFLMPGFIAGLDFNQIRWNYRLCYPQTTISALKLFPHRSLVHHGLEP